MRRRLRIAGRLFHQVLPDLAQVYCEGRSDWNLLYIVRVPSHYPWHWPVLCHRFSYMAKYRSPSPVAFGTDYEEGLASYKEEAAAAAQEVRSKFASPPPLPRSPQTNRSRRFAYLSSLTLSPFPRLGFRVYTRVQDQIETPTSSDLVGWE